MARIRVLATKSGKNMYKPKVMYFHQDNFDSYTTKRGGKYNVMVLMVEDLVIPVMEIMGNMVVEDMI